MVLHVRALRVEIVAHSRYDQAFLLGIEESQLDCVPYTAGPMYGSYICHFDSSTMLYGSFSRCYVDIEAVKHAFGKWLDWIQSSNEGQSEKTIDQAENQSIRREFKDQVVLSRKLHQERSSIGRAIPGKVMIVLFMHRIDQSCNKVPSAKTSSRIR